MADVVNKSDIVALLQESPEWGDDFGDEVLGIIQGYDQELDEAEREADRTRRLALMVAQLQAKRMAGHPNGEDSDDKEPESEDEDDQCLVKEVAADKEDCGPNAMVSDKQGDISDNKDNSLCDSSSDSGTEYISSGTDSDGSGASTPLNSCNPSPVTAPLSSWQKGAHPRPTEHMKENKSIGGSVSKRFKSLK